MEQVPEHPSSRAWKPPRGECLPIAPHHPEHANQGRPAAVRRQAAHDPVVPHTFADFAPLALSINISTRVQSMAREMDEPIERRGEPGRLRVHHGTKSVASVTRLCAEHAGDELTSIQKGRPMPYAWSCASTALLEEVPAPCRSKATHSFAS